MITLTILLAYFITKGETAFAVTTAFALCAVFILLMVKAALEKF